MPFNGSGLFVPLPPPTYPPVPGTTISSAYYTAVMEDLMAGLTNCVTRDGQGAMSVAFNAGGQKVINMAAPTNGGDGANKTYVDTQDATTLTSAASSAATLYAQKALVTDWVAKGAATQVAGLLGWKYYGSAYVIFDASAGTAPNGTAVDAVNSASVWLSGTHSPVLMGWNGVSTYGVRVDSCRRADSAAVADSAATAGTASDTDSKINAQTLGRGQSWQNVTGSRAFSTVYTNSTARPIMVMLRMVVTGTVSMDMRVSGATVDSDIQTAGNMLKVSTIVPAGASYEAVTSVPGTFTWMELR